MPADTASTPCCQSCFGCPPILPTKRHIEMSSPPPRGVPPRCLLLGPSGAGKTTFLLRLKSGSFFEVPATRGCNVEELQVTTKSSLIFSDISGDRRSVRLHFLNEVPMQELAILFFIDAAAPVERLPATLEDLVYAVAYAIHRSGSIGGEDGGTKYVGVVLNKQDLLEEGEEGVRVLGKIKEEVGFVMRDVLELEGQTAIRWEVLEGVSAKTGDGVKDVFHTVAKAVLGVDILQGPKPVTGGPTLGARVARLGEKGEELVRSGKQMGKQVGKQVAGLKGVDASV